MEDRRPAEDVAADHGRQQGRCHGRRQDDAGKIAVQFFQGEHDAGQGRIKGRRQTGTGTGRDEVAFFHARPPQGPAQALSRHGADLDGRPFAAQGQAHADADDATDELDPENAQPAHADGPQDDAFYLGMPFCHSIGFAVPRCRQSRAAANKTPNQDRFRSTPPLARTLA